MTYPIRLLATQWICVLLATLAGASAQAQTNAKPAAGLWWQPGANGQFMQLHMGPSDYALVSLSFGSETEPTYRVLQGPLELLNPQADQAIAQLSSPLYRVDNAGCLNCTESTGQTVIDNAGPYQLTFVSGTSAILRTPDLRQIHYEWFPLYRGREDLLANRIQGKRVLLENEGRAVLAKLVPSTDLGLCSDQLTGNHTAMRLQLASQTADTAAMGRYLNNAALLIENKHNPRIQLLTENDVVEDVGRECVLGAELYESGQVLAGPAEPISRGDPGGGAALSGDIRITLLD